MKYIFYVLYTYDAFQCLVVFNLFCSHPNSSMVIVHIYIILYYYCIMSCNRFTWIKTIIYLSMYILMDTSHILLE